MRAFLTGFWGFFRFLQAPTAIAAWIRVRGRGGGGGAGFETEAAAGPCSRAAAGARGAGRAVCAAGAAAEAARAGLLVFFLFFCATAAPSGAGASGGFVQEAPDYRRLTAMEYEERAAAAQQQIALARKASGESAALSALQKGLVFVLAHPTDGTNGSLISSFKSEAAALAPFWKFFYDIARDSLKSFQASALDAAQRASHLYILENVLVYIQNLNDKEENFNKVLDLIAKAKIKIPSEVHSQRLMDIGKGKTKSPSAKAAALLKKRRASAAKRKKAKEKREQKEAAAKAKAEKAKALKDREKAEDADAE